jgi:type VI secretion system protein VasD
MRWPGWVSFAVAAFAACFLNGCGVVQAIKDGTINFSKPASTRYAKTITVDLEAQPFINADPDGNPLSVVLRFYQLRDVTTFAELTYVQFQRGDQKLLKDDLLATKDVVLRPGVSTSMTEAMNEATQVVGVIAFFREPTQSKTWKLAIPGDRWKGADPVRIEADGNEIRLVQANPQVK